MLHLHRQSRFPFTLCFCRVSKYLIITLPPAPFSYLGCCCCSIVYVCCLWDDLVSTAAYYFCCFHARMIAAAAGTSLTPAAFTAHTLRLLLSVRRRLYSTTFACLYVVLRPVCLYVRVRVRMKVAFWCYRAIADHPYCIDSALAAHTLALILTRSALAGKKELF